MTGGSALGGRGSASGEGWADLPTDTPRYGQQAVGTHPSGMLSCRGWIRVDSYLTPIVYLYSSLDGNQSL